MSILVEEFMSKPVTTCTTEADVARVRDLMKLKEFSALPVVEMQEDQAVVRGIVTYRDIAGVYDDNVSVQQVMTNKVKIVEPTTTAKEAALMMSKEGIHHLVVVKDNQIKGLLSSADFVRLVGSYAVG